MVSLHVLLTVTICLSIKLPSDLQDLLRQQNDRMAGYNHLKSLYKPDSAGLVSRMEYGELLKAAMNLDSSPVSMETKSLIDDYVRSLPDRMDPEKVLMDLGSGEFAGRLMRRIEERMYVEL